MVIQEVGLIQVPNRKRWFLQRLYCFLENILLKFQLCIGHRCSENVLQYSHTGKRESSHNPTSCMYRSLWLFSSQEQYIKYFEVKFKYAISRFIFLFIIVLCITITTHHSFELMILNFLIPGFKNSNGQIQSVLVSLQFKTLVQNCLQLS